MDFFKYDAPPTWRNAIIGTSREFGVIALVALICWLFS